MESEPAAEDADQDLLVLSSLSRQRCHSKLVHLSESLEVLTALIILLAEVHKGQTDDKSKFFVLYSNEDRNTYAQVDLS